MPKRKTMADAEELSADLIRRAAETRNKAAFSDTVAILKEHPEAAVETLKTLKNLGYDTPKGGTGLTKSKQAVSALERVDRLKATATAHHHTLPDEAKSYPIEDVVPANKERIEALTVPMIGAHCLTFWNQRL